MKDASNVCVLTVHRTLQRALSRTSSEYASCNERAVADGVYVCSRAYNERAVGVLRME